MDTVPPAMNVHRGKHINRPIACGNVNVLRALIGFLLQDYGGGEQGVSNMSTTCSQSEKIVSFLEVNN